MATSRSPGSSVPCSIIPSLSAFATSASRRPHISSFLIPVPREDGRLETAVMAQGVSAAEAFLVARFRMYTWAVYHHKIQQAAAGLRVAIVDLLGVGAEPLPQLPQ